MPRALATLLIGVMIALHANAARVLTIVAPAAPGGGWDQTARVMQQILGRLEPDAAVQVQNVPGAAGTIGLARFVSAERGNPEALLVTGLVMVSAIVTNNSPVSLAETTPIARLTGEYEVIVVPADSRWRSLTELVDAFKAAPASVSWGGGSAGGTDDLLVRLIAGQVGVAPSTANYIAFPGGGAALAALLGGQVTAGVSGYGEFAGQIQSGAVRLLAVSSLSRVPGIDAPTLREQGIAVDLANWRGIVAPPGLTDIERDQLTARIERMASSAEWKQVLEKNGWADLFLGGPAFRQFLLAEQHRIEQVLRDLESANVAVRKSSALRVTPRTLPYVALTGLGLLLIATLFGAGANARVLAVRGPVWLLIAALMAHALIMPAIGFVPASTALFVIASRLIGSRRPLLDLFLGVAGATILFLAFTQGLGLDLPRDPITRKFAR
jgi:putative tricarboxylic transport membrane protein